MPERQTAKKAKQKLHRGRSASTAAGEYVREEMHHIRKGKHGARSTKQAIAIGLSKARRAGVPLRPPKRGASARTRMAAERAYEIGQQQRKPRARSRRRARATSKALRREGHRAASRRALAAHARTSAARRGHAARTAAARKAVRTKGRAGRRSAARKAARTRARNM
jgi:uncharacterized protein DUF6496